MTQIRLSGQTLRRGAKANHDGGRTTKLFGLFELDAAGTVLYTRLEPDGHAPSGTAPDYRGRNFYTEVAPFRNTAEFRGQLDGFSRGSQPAHSMDFTCDYEDGPLLVRVLLARIREHSQADMTKSILVHIRMVRQPSARRHFNAPHTPHAAGSGPGDNYGEGIRKH